MRQNRRIFLIIIVVMSCGNIAGQSNFDNEDTLTSRFPTVGAYLWCDYGQYRNEIFLDFAKKNGVSEIYLAQRDVDYPKFENDSLKTVNCYFAKTKYFLEMMHKRNLKTFLLIGSQKDSIEHFKSELINISEKIKRAIEYNKQVPDSLKFAGIHLDIEFSNIKDDTTTQYQLFSEWIVQSCGEYRKHIKMDFSIVLYNQKVKYKEDSTELYKVVINEGDRTFIQRYRNNADSIFDYVEPMIKYAASQNKAIIYTIQPKDFKGGYKHMYKQMSLLYDKTTYENIGIAIHTLTSWFIKAAEE